MRRLPIIVLTLLGALLAGFADGPSTPPMKLKVGDTAPDFTLRDQAGKDVALHDFQGKKTVVLAVFVFAFSGG